jgi:hypothetical protein
MEKFLETQSQLLSEGKYYEFEQNIENRARRHLAKKEFSECQYLCLTGLSELLKKGQSSILGELQDLLVKSSQVTSPNFQLLEGVFSLLAPSEGVNLLKKILKPTQDPRISELLARAMEENEDIGRAFIYWVGSDSYKDMLRTLQILIDRGFPGETDLFVARAVLMLLSYKKSGVAKHLIGEFKYLESPIINFSKFLIQALEAAEKGLVNVLKEKYVKSIERDHRMVKYLAQVEKVYFGSEPTVGLFGFLG